MTRRKLEGKAVNGELNREKVWCLKGGRGWAIIYHDVRNPEGLESGYIVLEEGSSIGSHTHEKDSESYTVVSGKVEINGCIYMAGETATCQTGTRHYCKNLDIVSIIRFVKR